MSNIQFSPKRSAGRNAIVVSFDLCGFSEFCNHPDAYDVLPKFVAALFDELNNYFLKWIDTEIWGKDFQADKLLPPDFMKYTGDGALLIWLPPEDSQQRQRYGTAIVKAMRNLQARIWDMVPKWEVEWHVHHLPRRARFGIATGLVYPLREKTELFEGEIVDYAGYCINLAVRLQNHCPEVGFIIHEPVLPRVEGLMRWMAHGMKGARPEPVLLFADEVPLGLDYLKSKFAAIGDVSAERIKAIQPENPSARHLMLVQPHFEALLVGPGERRQNIFFEKPLQEFVPIQNIKDHQGKVIRQEKWFYKLTFSGNPLVYTYVRSEPLNSDSE